MRKAIISDLQIKTSRDRASEKRINPSHSRSRMKKSSPSVTKWENRLLPTYWLMRGKNFELPLLLLSPNSDSSHRLNRQYNDITSNTQIYLLSLNCDLGLKCDDIVNSMESNKRVDVNVKNCPLLCKPLQDDESLLTNREFAFSATDKARKLKNHLKLLCYFFNLHFIAA